MKKTLLAAAACSFDLNQSSDYLVLIPEGVFRALDGRPFDAPHWLLTPERGQQLVAELNQRTIDMVIDYEHATIKSQTTGEPAPAAGWLKSAGFTYIEGVGLCSTKFEWLDKAQGFIESEEYKYLSPVFMYNKKGEVISLLHVALTNTPALDELPEARLAAAAQQYLSQTQQQDSTMDELLEQLRWMLNLPISATAEEIMAELEKLKAQISTVTGVAVAANSQNLFDAVTAIDGLKVAVNSQATPDPSQYVPIAVVTELQQQVATLTRKTNESEVDQLIEAACSDGRLTGEATIAWAKDLGKSNFEALKTHLDGLPKIAALSQRQTQQPQFKQEQQPKTEPDAIELSIAGQFGL